MTLQDSSLLFSVIDPSRTLQPPSSSSHLKSSLSPQEIQLIAQIKAKFRKHRVPNGKVSIGLGFKSCQILGGKVQQEVQLAVRQVDFQNTRLLSFQQIGRILTVLKVFRVLQFDCNYKLLSQWKSDSKRKAQELCLLQELWTLAGGVQQSKVQADVLIIILRVAQDSINIHQKRRTLRTLLLAYWEQQLSDIFDQTINKVSQERVDSFVLNWHKLTSDRLAYVKTGYLKANKFQEMLQTFHGSCTFKPALSSTTSKLQATATSKFLEKVGQSTESDRTHLLFLKEQQRLNKIKTLKEQKERLQVKQCTFQPKINTQAFSPKPKHSQCKHNYSQLANWQNQDPECTFKPHTKKSRQKASNAEIRGFDRSIERIRFGTQYQADKYSHIQKKAKPATSMSRRSVQKKALVYLDVNLPNGKSGRIGLFENDSPRQVSKNFAMTFGLSKDDQQEIGRVLQQQMSLYKNSL